MKKTRPMLNSEELPIPLKARIVMTKKVRYIGTIKSEKDLKGLSSIEIVILTTVPKSYTIL